MLPTRGASSSTSACTAATTSRSGCAASCATSGCTDGRPPRWPTIGIRLSSPANEQAPAGPVTGPVTLLRSLVHTTVDSAQVRHVSDPVDVERSIFAKPRGVRWTDFDLTSQQQQSLFEAGLKAGRRWVAKHPDGPPSR